MKRSLALICSLLVMAGCSSRIATPDITLQNQPVQQNETFTAQDYAAQSQLSSNKETTLSISKALFTEYFADDVEVESVSGTIGKATGNFNNITNTAKNLQAKGGMIFNILNKSKLAQKLGYLIADYPVRAKFNTHSKPDSTPRINAEQIAQLQAALQPGDLILNGNNNSFIHAILYTGNDTIIHSLATKGTNGKKIYRGN